MRFRDSGLQSVLQTLTTAILVVFATCASTSLLAAPYELVSVSTGGTPASTGSYMSYPGISADGRYVVFSSASSSLVSGDTNGKIDVFVRDRQLQTTTRVSVASDGTQADADSDHPSISSNGRYVVFESSATNLVAGDTNGRTDVFMRDLQTNTTTRLSVKTDGSQDSSHSSYSAAVSGDGHYVVFVSDANLTSAATTASNCYLRDTVLNTTVLASVSSAGAPANGFCANPVISDNGNRIAFESPATNLGTASNGVWQVILRDVAANKNILVSADAAGNPKTQGNESTSRSVQIAISADGQTVAFSTTSGSMDPTDTNGFQDVYVSTIPNGAVSGTIARVSTAPGNVAGDADSPATQGGRVSLSGTGTLVAFDTSATNIGANGVSSLNNVVIRYAANSALEQVIAAPSSAYQSQKMPALSGDVYGRYVAFMSGTKLDPRFDSGGVYVFDRQPQTGWWWNPNEGGRGYTIEVRGNNLFMATYLYDASGRTTWYGIGPGALTDVSSYAYSGTLTSYAGGQTLTGAFRQASVSGSGGNVSLTFTSPTTGTMTWPGGTIPLQKYDFGPGGSATTQPAGTPEAGWWYAPSEGGRGYAIEIQGGTLFMAGYMYDDQGNPVWFGSGPTAMSNATTYQSSWQQYGNGQTLTGTWHAPQVLNTNAGAITVQFASTTAATLTFPDGRQVAIQRYSF